MDPRRTPSQSEVVRIWRGRTTKEVADTYEEYLVAEGVAELRRRALAVRMLRRDHEGVSDFMVLSFWKDIASMSSFAGDDPARIRHLARDAEFLVELPGDVEIFEMREGHGAA